MASTQHVFQVPPDTLLGCIAELASITRLLPRVYCWVVTSITRRSWLGFLKILKCKPQGDTLDDIPDLRTYMYPRNELTLCKHDPNWPWKFILLTTRGYSCNVYLHAVYQTVYILKVDCWLILQYYLTWAILACRSIFHIHEQPLTAPPCRPIDVMQSHPQMFQWLWMYGVCLCNFYLHEWYSSPYTYPLYICV